MPDGVKISQLDPVASITNSDLFPLCQPSAQSETGFLTMKCSALDIADKVVSDVQYTSQLKTQMKTILGAINELYETNNFVDGDEVDLDSCTFACNITSTQIAFTIPLTKNIDASIDTIEIVDELNSQFTIPNVLSASNLSSLGDVSVYYAEGIGLNVVITNLNSTPTNTGASVVFCDEATISFSIAPES